VWTTFNCWQWDLNWHEPDVLCEFAELICFLANAGWSPAAGRHRVPVEAPGHRLPEPAGGARADRRAAAVGRIAAPALVFKAEAIVGPDQLAEYLGTGPHSGKVSDLAYHNSLMVQVWSSLAAGDARLLTTALRRFVDKPSTTAWTTYLRCHDDIGWAVDDADADAVGWDGASHRAFLSDYYSGAFAGSDACGLVFQENLATGDRRISGTAASLAGLESALEAQDPVRVDLAVRRLLLAHLVVLGFGGVPVLHMGDELALRNDPSWAQDPEHAEDNRWVHRPRMPWQVAERRHDEGTLEHRVWHGLRDAARVRGGLPAMHASVEAELLDPVVPSVLGFARRAPAQALVALHNTSEHRQVWPRDRVPLPGPLVDALTGDELGEGDVVLPPYACRWLLAEERPS
jgi:amylosucrase